MKNWVLQFQPEYNLNKKESLAYIPFIFFGCNVWLIVLFFIIWEYYSEKRTEN